MRKEIQRQGRINRKRKGKGMKRAWWILLSFTPTVTAVAQDGEPISYTVASRSAHETVWQRVEWETNGVGRVVGRTNEFVELATGLNHLDEASQQFLPSREEWVVYPGGSYTWVIPAKWKIGNGQTSDLTGWNQVHTLSATGSMIVTKFGRSVQRTILNVYTNW